MKKTFFVLMIALTASVVAEAQKYCIIDSKHILERVPEYKSAQTTLDAFSTQWQKEIDTKMQEVDKLYKTYMAERAMLSEEMRKKREDEITEKEKAAKDLQKQRFGYEGD